MQLGAWRLRRCISRRAAQIESFFASRESPKHWGDLHVSAWLQNTLAEGVGFELTVDLLIPRDCNYLHRLIDPLASAWYHSAAILNNLLHRGRVWRPY